MDGQVWLIDLDGEAELANGSFKLDGAIVEQASRRCIALGIKTGAFGGDVAWAAFERLRRADGARAWIAARSEDLDRSPPAGIWVRRGLLTRAGTTHLGTVRWLGVASDGAIVEFGVVPRDPTARPRRLPGASVTGLTDRSVEVALDSLAELPPLQTDRAVEDELRRLLWETDLPLARQKLQHLDIAVEGGVVVLRGMVPREADRQRLRDLAAEHPEVRGVVDRTYSAESLARS